MSEQNSEPRPFDPPVPPTAPPAPPTQPPAAPPAPPVAPTPQLPPVPQYGEYAPAGYVSPVAPTPPAAAANPYGVPGYAAPATPSNMYGVSTPGVAVGSAPAYAPMVRRRRTWDTVLTIILLVLGFFGMGLGVVYAAIFSNPEVLSQAMSSQGYGTFSGSAGSAPIVLVVSHVALFVISLGFSIALLIRGRIVVFWIPLAAGVIAAIIFWGTLASVLLSDPNFVSNVGR